MGDEDLYRKIVKQGAATDPWPDDAQVEFRPPVGADPVPNPASDTRPDPGGFGDPSINDVQPVPDSFPQGGIPGTDEGINPNTDTGPYPTQAVPLTDDELAERRRAAVGRSDDDLPLDGVTPSSTPYEPPDQRLVQSAIACSRCASRTLRTEGGYICLVCGNTEIDSHVILNDPTAEVSPSGQVYDGENPGADVGPYTGPAPEAAPEGGNRGPVRPADQTTALGSRLDPKAAAGPQVHTFASTGEAYDASQTHDEIHDGDVLDVPNEGVTGFLMAAWPVAVTEGHGAFHDVTGGNADVLANPPHEDYIHEKHGHPLDQPCPVYQASIAKAREVAGNKNRPPLGEGRTPWSDKISADWSMDEDGVTPSPPKPPKLPKIYPNRTADEVVQAADDADQERTRQKNRADDVIAAVRTADYDGPCPNCGSRNWADLEGDQAECHDCGQTFTKAGSARTAGTRTYVHPEVGCASDGSEKGVDADQTALGAGPTCPDCGVRYWVKPEDEDTNDPGRPPWLQDRKRSAADDDVDRYVLGADDPCRACGSTGKDPEDRSRACAACKGKGYIPGDKEARGFMDEHIKVIPVGMPPRGAGDDSARRQGEPLVDHVEDKHATLFQEIYGMGRDPGFDELRQEHQEDHKTEQGHTHNAAKTAEEKGEYCENCGAHMGQNDVHACNSCDVAICGDCARGSCPYCGEKAGYYDWNTGEDKTAKIAGGNRPPDEDEEEGPTDDRPWGEQQAQVDWMERDRYPGEDPGDPYDDDDRYAKIANDDYPFTKCPGCGKETAEPSILGGGDYCTDCIRKGRTMKTKDAAAVAPDTDEGPLRTLHVAPDPAPTCLACGYRNPTGSATCPSCGYAGGELPQSKGRPRDRLLDAVMLRGTAKIADTDEGPARTINVDPNAPTSTCSECGQPVVQMANGAWMHQNPGGYSLTCGDPDPSGVTACTRCGAEVDFDAADGVWAAKTGGSILCDGRQPHTAGTGCTVCGGVGCPECQAGGGGSYDQGDAGTAGSGLEPGDTRARPNMPTASVEAFVEAQWFDGTPTSIRERIAEATKVSAMARDAGMYDVAASIEAEIPALEESATIYEHDQVEEHLAALPALAVAEDYNDLASAGMAEDVLGFIGLAARDVRAEVEAADWEALATDGAVEWLGRIASENPGMLRKEAVTRAAAVDWIRDRTMPLLDVERRAEIIDGFVTEVERQRRGAFIAQRGPTAMREAELDVLEEERGRQITAAAEDSGAVWIS